MAKKNSSDKFDYVLMLKSKDAFFANSLWGLFKEIVSHRYWHWKRGDGWVD